MTFPMSSAGLLAASCVWVNLEADSRSLTASLVVLASSATNQWTSGTSLSVLASLVRSASCVARV